VSDTDTSVEARVAARSLAWVEGCYYWGDAIAYDGLLAVDRTLQAGLAEELASRLTRWYENAPDSWDDALAPGRAASELVQRGMLEPAVLERIVEAMTRLPRAAGVPLLRPHVPGWRTLVWVDCLYHLPSTLVAAADVLDRPELVADGTAVAEAVLAVLRTPASVGHAYDAGLRRGTGIEWTRGIGWALLGLLDTAGAAPGPHAAGLVDEAERLIGALAADQRDNGQWPTVLGATEAADETSVAGFFVAAARHPQLSASSRDRYAAAADRAEAALVQCVEQDGTVTGVSHDTHVTWSVQDYLRPSVLASPWGQGAALRAFATRTRP